MIKSIKTAKINALQHNEQFGAMAGANRHTSLIL